METLTHIPEVLMDGNPETVPTPGGAHRAQDALTRLRDKWGNRLPWFYSYSVPLIEDVPLARTPLASAAAHIRERLPIVGGDLEHFYDHKLRPALRRLVAVTDAELSRLEEANARAASLDLALDAEEVVANAADREALALREAALPDAHAEAAGKVATTGGHYDPENPAPEAVLRITREQEGPLAAILQLPWTPSDNHALLPAAVGWGVTIIVGAMIGVPLGILSGMVPVGNPLGRPALLAFFLAVGQAAAIAGKWAVKHASREASLRYWLGRAAGNWLPLTLFSVLTALGLLVIDSLVEREGLMASVRLRDLAAGLTGAQGTAGGQEWLYFLMAIIVTFGYVLNAWWEGWLSGRRDACLNRVRDEQERRFVIADMAWRSRPEVQAALEAVAKVRRLLAEMAVLGQRITARTAAIEGKRLTHQPGLDEAARRRIQDAYDQLCGTQATFDTRFEEARLRVEGSGSWWQDFLRHLGFLPRVKLRHRESKRPIR
jgi:hypothetical protein